MFVLSEVEHHVTFGRVSLLLLQFHQFLLNQVHDQVQQVFDFDHASCIMVVLGPFLVEELSGQIGDSGFLLLGRLQLTFQNDSDEQIQED